MLNGRPRTIGQFASSRYVAHYCLDLSEMFRTQRLVPVGIFLHGGERTESLTLGGDGHAFLTFSYLNCTLNALPWQTWRDSDNLVARLNLPNMRCRCEERIHVYACAVRGLMELESDPKKRLKYADFIDIYAGLTEGEDEQYQHNYPEEAKTMQSFSARFREDGIRIGEANMRHCNDPDEAKTMPMFSTRFLDEGKQIGEATVLLL
mgnify:CR=1 FL=1